MGNVGLTNVTKTFTTADMPAVRDVSLEIQDGEFFVLVGPSGCGKSTLLRIVAGLEEVDAGEVRIDGRIVNYVSPGDRNVAMVFQNYALYPQMTVEKNIDFPLRMRRMARAQRAEVVNRVGSSLGLTELMHRKVSELSGGQRQRVAVGRAIGREPAALLMDEPLSNLDALLRVQTREELVALHRRVGSTVIYVTHDQIEAMAMGHRIGVMCGGELVQVGTPQEVYGRPATRFVAGFIGSPPMNFLEAVTIGPEAAELVDGTHLRFANNGARAHVLETRNKQATLGVRPEAVGVAAAEGVEDSWHVELVENLGADQIALLRRKDTGIRARLGQSQVVNEGEAVVPQIGAGDVHVFDSDGVNAVLRSQA